MKGELLALRAYLHLDLLRLYGPVYKRKASALSIPYNDVSTIQNLPLLTADTVLNYKIIPDLELAEALLKNSDPTIEHGVMGPEDSEDVNLGYRQLRFNYYAVIALKARAHLYGGNKEKALIEANKLLNDPAVRTIFPFVDPNKLLANNTNPDRVFSTESFFGVFNSNRANIYSYTFSAENMGSNVLQPKADFIPTLFGDEIQDYRYRTHWATSTTAGINGDIFIKYKGIKDDKKELFYGTFMPLIRLSEIYYIAAECETTLSNKIERLNEIRAQRGLPEKQIKDETAFMTALRNEYLREFVGEGQIFFLYKRLYVNIVKAENGFDGTTIAASEARFVAPLPQSELENR